MTMNEINKTLYIPLYGKALISKRGIILQDRSAEQIWEQEKFPLICQSWVKTYLFINYSYIMTFVSDLFCTFAA